MSPSRRPPLKAVLAALLPIVLVLGIWLGGHPDRLPGFARNALVADHQTRVGDEAIQRKARDYYRPISTSSLSDASLTGVVKSLGDRFSHYLTASEFRQFNAPPSFTGIGVAVGPQRRGLLIGRVFDASPAAKAGLQPGELIVTVDGRRREGLSAAGADATIRCVAGPDVSIGIERKPASRSGHGGTRTVKITRATISEPVVASV